jgi:hypothetical protein
MSRILHGDRRTLGGSHTAVSTCTIDAAGEVIATRLDYVEYHRPSPPHTGPVFIIGQSASGKDILAVDVEDLIDLAGAVARSGRVEPDHVPVDSSEPSTLDSMS